jgi:hypothetical protein
LCVYAITGPGPLRTQARGLQGERLRLVVVGPVAAIVGDVARAPQGTVRDLRRYDETIRRLTDDRPALLPARFNTCFRTTDELTAVLRSRRSSLRAALARVRHRAQMTVRVISKVRGTHPGVGPASPPALATRPAAGHGTTYLRQRMADAARAREVPGFDRVRDAVRRWVRAERVETRAGVATVYHLVPRAAGRVYRAAAERAAAESGLRMVVSGPWPPYAFVAF